MMSLNRQMDRLSRKGDAAFQQESANLVDQRGATPHEPIPNPVHCLPVELLLRLELRKAHVLLGHGFGIQEVVLVRLPIGFDELSRDQSHLVTLFS